MTQDTVPLPRATRLRRGFVRNRERERAARQRRQITRSKTWFDDRGMGRYRQTARGSGRKTCAEKWTLGSPGSEGRKNNRGSMFNLRRVVVTVFAIALISTAALAQPTTGTVKGTLTDDSGGVIPRRERLPGWKWSDQNGADAGRRTYTFPGLAPGDYTVSLSFPGFQSFLKQVTVGAGGAVQVPIQTGG